MPSPDERRRLPRRRTQLSALIVHGDDLAAIPCTIRDQNELGAKLLVQPGSSAPDAFRLLELHTGVLWEARIVWRDQAFVGVALQIRADLAGENESALKPFADLWRKTTAR